MSQLGDLIRTFRNAHFKKHIPEQTCVDLFLEVLSSLEWMIFDDIDYTDAGWQEDEYNEAYEMLFGDSES